MRVLVISRNAWDDTNAIGNTFSNFFAGIDGLEFASIYFRESNPNNPFCTQYYRVTEAEIIKKWFVPNKIGRQFVWNNTSISFENNNAQKNERKLIRLIRKCNLYFAYKVSDSIWYTKKWLNHNLAEFVETFCPDLMVTFVKSSPQYFLTVKYLKEKYHIPLFSWIADDEYTALARKNSARCISNLNYILDKADAICGCSKEICDYYNSIFGCQAVPLYKGCDLSANVKNKSNCTLNIVYAGNLLYGRKKIVKLIAEYLDDYDFLQEEVIFNIYSNTELSAEDQAFFCHNKRSKYMGKADYETIKKRLSEADIVLHVESFEADQVMLTKYSFSTKIIDCLQSGSVLLAVGPKEQASISYVKKIEGAYVIDNLSELKIQLLRILKDKETLPQRAKQIRLFAETNHNAAINAEYLKKTFETIVERSK